MVGRMRERAMNNAWVDPVALFLRMQAKEEVQIDPLFPRLTIGLIHMGPNIVRDKRNGERRVEFKIQDLMCKPFCAYLLRPTHLENLGRNCLLIPLGNTQHRQLTKT